MPASPHFFTPPRFARAPSGFAPLVACLALMACNDPTKGKPKAVTTDPAASSPQTVTAPSPQAVTAPSPAELPEGDFEIVPEASKIGWVGSKVTGKHEGGFGKFRGELHVEKALEKSKVTVDVDAESITTDSDKLVKHLRSKDFFDVGLYPKLDFVSTAIRAGTSDGATHTVTGNLTMHGVTKAITFPATVKGEASGISVQAEFSVNRKDFGILYSGKADDLIREDVLIKLDLKAKKKG